MKKALALILAVVMCVGMASVAFAIDVTDTVDTWDIIGNDAVIKGDTIEYVAGSEFYVQAKVGAEIVELTKAEVVQGSTTVFAPAYFNDTEGNNPLGWVVMMKTKDIAAVKEYDTVLKIEGKLADGTIVKDSITLTVKDTDMIDENDINKARMNDNDVETKGRYVVSADAFAAIKAGETFKFPYDGYTLAVPSGIKNALNFRASIEKIDAVVERYGEDKVLGVIDFKYKNSLAVEVGIEMECTEYSSTHTTNQAYVYRIEGDKLVLVTDKATYNAARGVVAFSTNKLGTFIASAEPLTTDAAPSTTKTNPGTGANDVIGLAVAGAVVAMAAGFVALKK